MTETPGGWPRATTDNVQHQPGWAMCMSTVSIYISQRLAARGVGLLSNDNQYSNHCYIFTYSRVLEGPVVLRSARRACCAASRLLKHFQKTLEALKGEPCGEGLAGVSPQLLSFDL